MLTLSRTNFSEDYWFQRRSAALLYPLDHKGPVVVCFFVCVSACLFVCLLACLFTSSLGFIGRVSRQRLWFPMPTRPPVGFDSDPVVLPELKSIPFKNQAQLTSLDLYKGIGMVTETAYKLV